MHILLLGATGRTGGKVMELLLERGDDVTTFGRRASNVTRVTELTGDLMDETALECAFRGQEAAINCLQSTGDPPLCSTIATYVTKHNSGLRYITVGGAGVKMAGDNKGIAGWLVGGALKLLQPRMLADRQREADLLRNSMVRWTMLRPPRLTDGPTTGEWHFAFDRPTKLHIARPDLASAVVDALSRKDLEGKAPFVSAA